MATDDTPEKTTVSDRGIITISGPLQRRLDIAVGDKLRWGIDTERNLSVEVVRQRYGAFNDFEPVSMSDGGAETYDVAGDEIEQQADERLLQIGSSRQYP